MKELIQFAMTPMMAPENRSQMVLRYTLTAALLILSLCIWQIEVIHAALGVGAGLLVLFLLGLVVIVSPVYFLRRAWINEAYANEVIASSEQGEKP